MCEWKLYTITNCCLWIGSTFKAKNWARHQLHSTRNSQKQCLPIRSPRLLAAPTPSLSGRLPTSRSDLQGLTLKLSMLTWAAMMSTPGQVGCYDSRYSCVHATVLNVGMCFSWDSRVFLSQDVNQDKSCFWLEFHCCTNWQMLLDYSFLNVACLLQTLCHDNIDYNLYNPLFLHLVLS